jgi:hypothetical protein
MICVDRRGDDAECEVFRPRNRSTMSRYRDLIIVTLHRNNIPLREIGEAVGLSHVAVLKRLKAIPKATQDFYERYGLTRFLSAIHSPFAMAAEG